MFAGITRKLCGCTSPIFIYFLPVVMAWFYSTSGFMDDVMVTYHGTNGQTALDKIRL